MKPHLPFVVFVLLLAACSGDGEQRPARPRTSLVTAGDIASCWWRGDEATARLLDRIDGVVAPLGDLVYQDGTPGQFARCYGPTWGRHRARTRPTPGNHDYRTREGAGYWGYFGANAGERGKGWYAYDLDGWRVLVLNSEAPIGAESEQVRWLRAELAAHPSRCTLAYMHRPAFSSGKHGGAGSVRDVLQVLYDGGVDVLLGGHDHHYERMAPQDPDGKADPARGIRQFVVGTGGAPTYRPKEAAPNSEVMNDRALGVLRLVFHPGWYEWQFVPIRGHRFTDSGRGTCH